MPKGCQALSNWLRYSVHQKSSDLFEPFLEGADEHIQMVQQLLVCLLDCLPVWSSGAAMTKMSVIEAPFDCALRDSLSVIRQIHAQRHVLTGMASTPNVLASQIELCDVLLVEILGIRDSLAKDLGSRRARRRKPQFLN